MLNSMKRENAAGIVFWVLVSAYAAIFLIQPALGPTDDFVFLDTLQSGKPLVYYSVNFPYYDVIGMGRFTPIGALEYNLFLLFTKNPAPWMYFALHCVQFILFAWLAVTILKKVVPRKLMVYATAFLIFLLPGFSIVWFRLQLGERNVMFLLALTLIFYLKFQEREKWLYLAGAVAATNLAMYYKEMAFMAIGAFGFIHGFLTFKNASKKALLLDGILVASAVGYLALYKILIIPHVAPSALYLPNGFSIIAFLKNVANYALFSDSVPILVMLPLTVARIFHIIKKRGSDSPIWDTALMAGTAYTLGYVLLRLYGPYYLSPVYILGAPAVLYFMTRGYSNAFWKLLSGTTLVLIFLNAIPAGLYYLTYNKYLPINFNETLDYLKKEIEINKEKPGIFFYGTGLGPGRGTYGVFAEFMRHKGVSDDAYDLKSNADIEKPAKAVSKKYYPFTVFESNTISEVSAGDYLIVAPQSTRLVTGETRKELESEGYELQFKTESRFAFPNVNLKTLVKFLIVRALPGTQEFVSNTNVFQSPDYYVYAKK